MHFNSTHHPQFWQLHAAKHQSCNCMCTNLNKTYVAPTHCELYSLTHHCSSIRHCQSTSFRPATEPCNATYQPWITIVALAFNSAHPLSDTQILEQPHQQLQSSIATQTSTNNNQLTIRNSTIGMHHEQSH